MHQHLDPLCSSILACLASLSSLFAHKAYASWPSRSTQGPSPALHHLPSIMSRTCSLLLARASEDDSSPPASSGRCSRSCTSLPAIAPTRFPLLQVLVLQKNAPSRRRGIGGVPSCPAHCPRPRGGRRRRRDVSRSPARHTPLRCRLPYSSIFAQDVPRAPTHARKTETFADAPPAAALSPTHGPPPRLTLPRLVCLVGPSRLPQRRSRSRAKSGRGRPLRPDPACALPARLPCRSSDQRRRGRR